MKEETTAACGNDCGCERPGPGIARRDFLKAAGFTPIALLTASSMPVMAGPFEAFEQPGPTDKRLSADWIRSLTERGTPTVYRGTELAKIGMPIGGIGAGQLYLGGDGKLWHWDIFNIPHGTGDGGYAHPPLPQSPLEQGFAVEIKAGGKTTKHSLDSKGFKDIRFSGQYPIADVEYRDPDSPVAIKLEAFSPFIPLNAEDSSLPATILNYTVTNHGKDTAEIDFVGWLQNAALQFSPPQSALHHNRIVSERGFTALECSASRSVAPQIAARPDHVVEDWNISDYKEHGWKATGEAFGTGPVKKSAIPAYQGDVGGDGERVVNSHASAPGESIESKDRAQGTLTGPAFVLDRNYIHIWIGGGNHPGFTCLNILIDGKVVRSLTGPNNNRMSLQTVDVRRWQNQQAVIEILDKESGPWGNIGVGTITLSDGAIGNAKIEELPDYGEMILALLGSHAEKATSAADPGSFEAIDSESTERPVGEPLIGQLGRQFHLKPGESHLVSFIIAWRFPNLTIDGLGKVGRHYAAKFDKAKAVVSYITDNFDRLTSQTRLWRETWYDGTLPYWFLDRTLLNVSTLATGACYRFANGRFYAWEGVGCCAGTCTHVWHYAHAMARLFPELERDIRERVDFGLAYHEDTGVMGFRAEFDRSLAVDGQTGTLLRAYREHQMSADSNFLKRNWPHIKGAFDPLFKLDADEDGVLEGGQMNTLDQPWYGKVSWLSSLYIAALRAGAAMADEMHDVEFSKRCTRIADAGMKNVDAQLFNGEYYTQTQDPGNPRAVGSYDGCEIDQVFGAGWAGQVGLDGVLPHQNVRTALKSLFKYSFLPDVGPYREAHKPGRWYALAGEAGLLMCSWPRGDSKRSTGGFDYYLNECMTGFEHQAAGHMIREGLVTEGLAVIRAIHDRYHASKRNPWNEVECGDHYSRAMASYGVYLSALGFEYHGPKGHLAFAPRFGAGNFKAAFTGAEGWGSYKQTIKGNQVQAVIEIKWGSLKLNTVAISLPVATNRLTPRVRLDGRPIASSHTIAVSTSDGSGNRALTLSLPGIQIRAGQRLVIQV